MIFRKKPVEVEACRLPTVPHNETAATFEGWARAMGLTYSINQADEPGAILIHTLEGAMRARPGDWIIRGVKGEFYPCKPDIFEETYQRPNSNGCVLIVAERDRQISDEGWSADHDAEHDAGELALAAACYAICGTPSPIAPPRRVALQQIVGVLWPWEWSWWKPTSPLKALVRSGALCAAEIDRLLAAGEKL